MKELSRTPETVIAEMLALATELEQTPSLVGGSAGQIISGIKADLAALKQLNTRVKHQQQIRDNRLRNCQELYAKILGVPLPNPQ